MPASERRDGFRVGRYVSLERLIEDSKESYYDALKRSSERWHEGQHDLVPWCVYFLGILRSAYREFEERVGAVRAPRGAKTETVRRGILAFPGEFAISDVERACWGPPGLCSGAPSRISPSSVPDDLVRADFRRSPNVTRRP